MNWSDEYVNVRRLMIATIEAIAKVEKALISNPTESEARKLNSLLVELQAKETVLRDRRDALLDNRTNITPPSDEQVERVKALAREVEALTGANIVASAAIEIATKAVGLASELVT